jgi:hypothetical protein
VNRDNTKVTVKQKKRMGFIKEKDPRTAGFVFGM